MNITTPKAMAVINIDSKDFHSLSVGNHKFFKFWEHLLREDFSGRWRMEILRLSKSEKFDFLQNYSNSFEKYKASMFAEFEEKYPSIFTLKLLRNWFHHLEFTDPIVLEVIELKIAELETDSGVENE